MTRHPHNLPLQLTSLVGRAREIEALRGLLIDDRARIVTLTGPGGSGKTRLALEVASALLPAFADGVFLVSLAPLRDAGLVASGIAQTLEVRESGGAALVDSLTAFLRERTLLLVLDNFEHLLDSAPLVADLLTACTGLQIIVTSRAALHLRGEHEFPVPPLALPDQRVLLDAEALQRYAAVSLFIERALAVKPDFVVTAETARDVSEICARLDGLPLAIELAAARSKLLSPTAMLARLERRLPLLGGGARDLPERQRTLRGTIAWSYDLLTEPERLLFRRLSVFVGGCDLETIEGMCGDASDSATLDLVASLIDKNLLRQAEALGTEARFAMLETIREYGLEVLHENDELEAAQRRHAEYFLAFAEEAEPNISGQEREHWLRRLEQEHDNLRAALGWCVDQGRIGESLRLAAALGQFWQYRGYISEGGGWLQAVLANNAGTGTPERAKALASAGMLALYQGEFAVARAYHEQALAIHRAAEDRWSIALAINDLGTVALYQGDYAAAHALYAESLEIRQELGDRRGTAVSFTNLGLVALAQGDLANGRHLHEEALTIRRELEDRTGIARSLTRLGIAATEQGDYAAAQEFLAEAGAVARDLGDRQAVAWSLTNLGAVAIEVGNFDEAQSLLEEGLRIRRELGNAAAIPRSLWQLIRLDEARGDLALARAHCEEALAIARDTNDRQAIGLWLTALGDIVLNQDDFVSAASLYEQSLALRRQLGDEGAAAIVLAKLAQVYHHDGDLARARRLLEESVSALRTLGDRQGLAASLTNLAQMAGSEGAHDTAEELYREAAVIHHELGKSDMLVLCLRGLAAAALSRGARSRAACLLGAAVSLGNSLAPPSSVDEVKTEIAASPLGPEAANPAILAAWRKGRALSPHDALAYALDKEQDNSGAAPASAYPGGLSEREVEVLRRMAAGKSNPEIAAELFISVNTVYRHVSHIFAKTGAGNRVEAATYAQRHALL